MKIRKIFQKKSLDPPHDSSGSTTGHNGNYEYILIDVQSGWNMIVGRSLILTLEIYSSWTVIFFEYFK